MPIGKKCWPFIITKEIKVHRHASYNWIDQLPKFDQKKQNRNQATYETIYKILSKIIINICFWDETFEI